MALPIITLTTDFGTSDGTVGAMIGVIRSICPNADIVPVAHDVPAHDIARGAWAMLQAVPFFPPGTIHVGVVDPGVGTQRRGILIDTGREFLVGPDNGLLSWCCKNNPGITSYSLENPAYRLTGIGVTFDGRDVFASTAAHLAQGVDPVEFGPSVDDYERLPWPESRATPDRIEGEVLLVDTFGNLITNINFADVISGFPDSAPVVTLEGRVLGRIARGYDEIRGPLGVVVNGTGLLEIASPRARAEVVSAAHRGARVCVHGEGESQ